MDPPWYLECYKLFMNIAYLISNPNAIVLSVMPPITTRPTVKDEYEKLEEYLKKLVQHCANNSEYSTCYLHQSCVVVSQQCHRIASFLRLVLSQISGTVFHCYLGNAVLGIYIIEYKSNVIEYQMPPFERNTLRINGIVNIPDNWRTGDLLIAIKKLQIKDY